MAEEKVEGREVGGRQRPLWTQIFQGFRVALDFNKLLLAAAGILVMSFGWWLLAIIFSTSEPRWGDYSSGAKSEEAAWKQFKADYRKWNLNFQAAGPPSEVKYYTAADVANSSLEYKLLEQLEQTKDADRADQLAKLVAANPTVKLESLWEELQVRKKERKRSGELRGSPWGQDRGPNPYLMVTGQARSWEQGRFLDWLLTKQVPVLLEPLIKMVAPVRLFFHPHAGPLNSFYFLLVMFWTVVTWAIFGGAITRIAAVQVARQEKITLMEAMRFTCKRWLSYVTAPLFPLLFVFFLLIIMCIFGFFHMIPILGEFFVDGLFFWVMIVFGLLMAVGLIGLVGWPLMSATISTEGTDSWEAVSRSYSYVFQAPWQYIWYGIVALAYGAVVVFFVGFMGSMTVYLAKWGVSQTPWVSAANRDPSFLFAYAPNSFGWRPLLLQGVQVNDRDIVRADGTIDEGAYTEYVHGDSKDSLTWYNKVGAFLVAIWVGLFFLLVLGFGYSYFWSAATIVYLLMRKRVDDAEMDEVYLEEDEGDTYSGPLTPPPASAPAKPTQPLTMVESPTLKPPPAPTPPAPAPAPSSAPPTMLAPPPSPATTQVPTPAPEPPPVIPPPPEATTEPAPAPEPKEPEPPPPPQTNGEKEDKGTST